MPKILGKSELKELGCKFAVLNVPIFAAKSDKTEVYSMKMMNFNTTDEIKQYFSKNLPVIVFDMTSVYPNNKVKDNENGNTERCCPVSYQDFESLRNETKETQYCCYG